MRLNAIASGRGGDIPLRALRVENGMPWKLKMVDSFRFLTIFAIALAAWIVLMWLTLAAVSASEAIQGDQTHAPVAPAPAVDEPPSPNRADAVAPQSKAAAERLATPARAGGAA